MPPRKQYTETLKEKIAEKDREILTLNSTIKDLKNGVLSDPNYPKWFYDTQVDNRTLHIWIKERNPSPKEVRYLFRKFPANKPIFEEMVNRDSPFYLPPVRKALERLVELENMGKERIQLNIDLSSIGQERNNLNAEIKDLENERDSLTPQVDSLKVDLQTYQTGIQNIHGKEGLEKIQAFRKKVVDFVKGVWKDNESLMETDNFTRFKIDKTELNGLTKEAEILDLYLKSDQFKEEDIESLKSELAEIRDNLLIEKEQTEENVRAVMSMNPVSQLGKISESVDIGINMMNCILKLKGRIRADELGNTTSNFFEAKERSVTLLTQIERIKRKGVVQRS